MTYTLPAWADAPSTTTPVDATNLLLLNTALADLDTRVASAATDATAARVAQLTPTTTKTGSYTAASGDLVMVDATAGPITITLPACSTGIRVAVKKLDSTANVVTVQRAGSDTIGSSGSSSVPVKLSDQVTTFQGNGTNWVIPHNHFSPASADARYVAKQSPVTLTDGATINTDASLGVHFRVTLGGNRTIANPTNLTDGQKLLYEIIQDGTGSRTITWGSKFTWGTTVAVPTLTTTASKRDFIGVVYNSSADKLYGLAAALGY